MYRGSRPLTQESRAQKHDPRIEAWMQTHLASQQFDVLSFARRKK